MGLVGSGLRFPVSGSDRSDEGHFQPETGDSCKSLIPLVERIADMLLEQFKVV
jgi:hypothetical protein